jgi:hypothetical protein
VVDQVVAEHDSERLVADEHGRAQHRMAEAERGALPDEMHVGQFGWPPYRPQPFGVALLLQRRFQLRRPVEVIGERLLAAPGDHQDLGQPGADRFLDDVLQRRGVHHRQQLLRHRLCGWQEPGA